MKQYKVVPGPKNIMVMDMGKTQPAFNTFADIINQEAVDGWEYHSMETLTLTQNPGCLSNNPVSRQYYMLIFVKDVCNLQK